MKKTNLQPLEPEEIFLDQLLKKKEALFALWERRIEAPLKKKIFWFFFLFGISLFFSLVIFSFNLQIINYQKYQSLAQNNKFLDLRIKAQRGIIYARDGEQLVFNEANFALLVDFSKLPKENKERDKILKELSQIINLSFSELKEKIKPYLLQIPDPSDSSAQPFLLKENLSHQELILIETKIDQLPGVKIKKELKRRYLKEESLSHILGYLGKISSQELKNLGGNYTLEDWIGKEGIEKVYEKILAEKKGTLEIERDAQGRVISKKIKRNPCSGQSIVLTLDLALQKKISQTLKEILQKREGKAAAAVALNPQNGEVLASVSLPSFDNNLFAQGITQKELEKLNKHPLHPQLNRVIGGVYPVGSIIKPLIGLAALQEGIITPQTSFFCPLQLCLENKYTHQLECFKDWKFHGQTDIKKAIAQSVNPFFYLIGGGYQAPKNYLVDPRLPKFFTGLGIARIEKWLKKFGWGQKTGIDLPGEVAGRIPTPQWKKNFFKKIFQQKWYLGDTYNLSIGQGYLLVSPLQVAVAFQVIANGEKIYRPHLLKKILPQNKECFFSSSEIVKTPIILKENFLAKSWLKIIKEGMKEAVSSPAGSAFLLHDLPVKVAAKTGTAQISEKDLYHNWLIVFGPIENPEILLSLVVEKVRGTRIVAQKAAREILTWYFSKPQSLKDLPE